VCVIFLDGRGRGVKWKMYMEKDKQEIRDEEEKRNDEGDGNRRLARIDENGVRRDDEVAKRE
jgi:hypothetical protein